MALKTLHPVLVNPAFDQTVVSMFLRVKKISHIGNEMDTANSFRVL